MARAEAHNNLVSETGDSMGERETMSVQFAQIQENFKELKRDMAEKLTPINSSIGELQEAAATQQSILEATAVT